VNLQYDALTQLPNRLYFIELLEAALTRAHELAVLFIDLDRFRQVNGALGYAAGDKLLKAAAGRLRGLLDADCFVGRVGADEFALGARGLPGRYLDALRWPYRIEGHELFVTPSIGVAIFPNHGLQAAELLGAADHAMSRAKSSGGDALEIFAIEDRAPALARLHLENALRRALENGELRLVYQPVVSMNGTVDGLEALLTWRHSFHGSISPRRFIPIAEETGLIVPIGAWLMEQACIQGARWLNAGHRNACISVSVSGRQFEQRDFVAQVARALQFSGFPPQYLELELAESYLMRNLPESLYRMREIRDLGVSISIDDFGTGYSSLSNLSKLPVDTLKIDQSFLRRLLEPKGSLPVVQSIIRLAHDMNLTVVAEGVETEAQLDLVRILGCDKVQGHVYGPAVGPDEAEQSLRHNTILELGSRF
jgi:predicted signal transduction protein with EAL and GGDEF domain